MARIFFKKEGRKPSLFASLGLLTTVFATITILLSGPILGYFQDILGAANQVFEMRVKLVELGALLLFAAALLTFTGIIHGRYSIRYRTSWRGMISAMLAALIAAPSWMMYQAYQHHPIIHDVSTNLRTPLNFKHLPERQYLFGNPVNLVGGRLAPNYTQLHQEAYPLFTSTTYSLGKSNILDTAINVASSLGWQLVYQDTEEGRIEAICIDPWLQQKNQIVVRVRADAAGSKLDIRSVSALEVGDFGVNAEIISSFLAKMQQELNKA